jgi:dephospho-CoA kinase
MHGGNVAPVTSPGRVLLGGGIGSGKSAAAAFFAALGAAVLSADRAGHAVLEPGGAAAAQVGARWPGVVAGGRIDRAALADLVFGDGGALAELEAITYPAIARVLTAQVAVTEARVVVVEMPLPVDLLGPGWRWVVVDAPDEVRMARLLARGMAPEDAARRMAAQPSRVAWLGRADLVVDNGGDLGHLEAGCRLAWEAILGWQGPPEGGAAR